VSRARSLNRKLHIPDSDRSILSQIDPIGCNLVHLPAPSKGLGCVAARRAEQLVVKARDHANDRRRYAAMPRIPANIQLSARNGMCGRLRVKVRWLQHGRWPPEQHRLPVRQSCLLQPTDAAEQLRHAILD
jgi:hypothetical protein